MHGRTDTDYSDFFFETIFFFHFFFEKSVSYQKKDGRGHACPSFFWYDIDSGHWGSFSHDAAQFMKS